MTADRSVRSRSFRALTALVALGAAGSAALAGPDWVERGDAGSSPLTAQAPFLNGGTALNSISGNLSGPPSGRGVGDFEDMYYIGISDPTAFHITLINADFNPQFFLFNVTLANQAYGLLANDDTSLENTLPTLVSHATDATGVVITAPGDYLLAITGYGDQPLSITGLIFNQASPTEISGPDGVGGFNPLAGWTGGGEWGHYNFTLEGTDFPHIPAPGTAGLLLAAGLAGARRRRA